MQYTGDSFARPLLSLVNPRAARGDEQAAATGLFPTTRTVSTHAEDPFEAHLIRPAVGSLVGFFRRFSWIQNGNLQLYILYGLLFLIGILVWTMGSGR